MIPDLSKSLLKLKLYPNILCDISRGIERETLRITKNGNLSNSDHPCSLGKSLTHPWITTDFSESLLEFITPVHKNVKYILKFLRDLHRYTARSLDNEFMWPLSMPCYIKNQDQIRIAQYGISNIGKFKSLYRKGLKNRYGSLMQTISGVHYNFSFPIKFWEIFFDTKNLKNKREKISNAYLCLVRNYYRYGWIILYLFGSSPAMCNTFLTQVKKTDIHFEKNNKETCYLPYATSLRMSDVGYTNKFQNQLKITFNNLKSYISFLKKAKNKPSLDFLKIGLKDKNNQFLQINSNYLQIENELYTPIRLKRKQINDESLSDALLNRGIEYLEIRALDVNPFNVIGINSSQIYFLDLFLIWCLLIEAPKIDEKEFVSCKKNWNKIILEGRKPGQLIEFENGKSMKPLKEVGYVLFSDLIKIVNMLDIEKNSVYYRILYKLIKMFDNPDLTYSGKILPLMLKKGINEYGLELAKKYYKKLVSESYEIVTNKDFLNAKINSINQQFVIEENDEIDFQEYLFSYLDKNK